MRKEFSANVSHELKTPLTSISGYAEIMKNGLVKPEDMTGFAERIYNEASRLITLVEDIIKLSKLDEGNVELEKEEVDLYKLTREILTRLSPQAEKRKVHVEVTGEPVEYVGIRQILDEMIYHICENAIKYNKEGGKLTVWVGNTLQLSLIHISAVLLMLTFWAHPDWPDTAKVIYMIITYCLLVLGYTCVNIPYGTLCGAMTQDIDERTKINTCLLDTSRCV